MITAREAWRRRGPVGDVAIAAVCVAATVLPTFQSGLFDGSPLVNRPAPLAICVMLGVAAAAAAFVRRTRPLVLSACALLGWLVAGAWPALLFAQYSVGAHLRSSRQRVAVSAVTVLAVAWPLWTVAGGDGSVPVSVAVCVLPVLTGQYLASRRALVANLEERARFNERAARLRIEQARAEERAQIARDMHDVVTHRVSLMVLHATALESSEGRGAVAIAGQIQGIGRDALTELRTLVGVLRDGGEAPLRPQPGLADLAELVDASRALGLAVELSIEPDLNAPSLVGHAAYRVVQEALTNVHKHTSGARTEVVIGSDQDELRLVVRDSGGAAVTDPVPGGGHGLLGIGERVRLVGGSLDTRRLPGGGFEVVARMPAAREATR